MFWHFSMQDQTVWEYRATSQPDWQLGTPQPLSRPQQKPAVLHDAWQVARGLGVVTVVVVMMS